MSSLLLLASGGAEGPAQSTILAVYVGVAVAVVLAAFGVAMIGQKLEEFVHGKH